MELWAEVFFTLTFPQLFIIIIFVLAAVKTEQNSYIKSNPPSFQNLNDSFSPRGIPGTGINIGRVIHCRLDYYLLLLPINSTLP